MTQKLSTQSSAASSHRNPGEELKRQFSWQVASNLFISFKYAWNGVSYAFQTQRNFRIQVVIGLLALSLALYLHLSAIEMVILFLTIGAVLTMELINTALESVVDLTVKQTYHELARIAKDCAAGAVVISAIVSILVGSVLLLPPLLVLVQAGG
ncbi:diacylglycerol kinase family protein [Trichothermofontia sichuanensis B231]|uniref:diacylglycerol kinase family protein n=1 Tax=Trichothermofontia sichuanensis TaxID=3045816 RepID=UPI002245B011|nr:diacylglycerol kinase family protein [Trichothermofontia sichuanensis]UZQ53449.1 diacylglycerol kinase family protein [Trichothermofontia sichuanensis B231]